MTGKLLVNGFIDQNGCEFLGLMWLIRFKKIILDLPITNLIIFIFCVWL